MFVDIFERYQIWPFFFFYWIRGIKGVPICLWGMQCKLQIRNQILKLQIHFEIEHEIRTLVHGLLEFRIA